MPGGDAVDPGVGGLGDPRDGGVPGDLGELGPGDSGEHLLGLVKTRQTIEELRKLRGQALVGFMMNTKWYARENDLIGGWCVVPLDLPPSSGIWEIADFIDERAARHIAWLHNAWLARRREHWAGLPDLPPEEQDH